MASKGRVSDPRMSAPTAPVNPLNNIRRGELKRLLLRRGTSEVEVHNMVEDIIAERDRWTARALGQRMDLTFHEKIRLRIKTIACIDRSKKMVQLYFREQKRERDRMRWQRNKQTLPRDLSPMAKQIAQLVAEKSMSVAEIVDVLRRPQRRKREAARSAVRRALRELIAADLLEVRVEARPTGGYERLVRLKKPENAALLDTSMREKSVVVDGFGEASDFRPPVTRPPVKFSPPHRRSSMKPDTSRVRPSAENATRLTDSYYTAGTAKAALSERGSRAGARSKVVGLKSDVPNERAGQREEVPPSRGNCSARRTRTAAATKNGLPR
jgi:DNA-binding transcriptional ArsR family regulator